MSRSKAIGTSQGETPFVNWAKENGFPFARRLALSGSTDEGDVLLDPVANDVIVEVKAGKVAERSEPAWLADAMSQLDAEAANFGARRAFLVTKRKGYGEKRVGEWWAWVRLNVPNEYPDDEPGYSLFSRPRSGRATFPVRMTVAQAVGLLRNEGYGAKP